MLSGRTRSFAAALAAAAVVVGSASPALALQDEGLTAREKSVPVVLDAMVLRPLGLVLTAGGAVLAVLPTAFVAITRPTDIVKPLDTLIAGPFRYTFMDPLGEHPPIGAGE
jgi:hypothetical protein